MKKILIVFVLIISTSCSNMHQEGQHEHTIQCGEYCDYEHIK